MKHIENVNPTDKQYSIIDKLSWDSVTNKGLSYSVLNAEVMHVCTISLYITWLLLVDLLCTIT